MRKSQRLVIRPFGLLLAPLPSLVASSLSCLPALLHYTKSPEAFETDSVTFVDVV